MSAPAPVARRVKAQARFDTLTFLRNGEQTLVSIVLPALALVGGVLAPWPDLGAGRRVDIVTPGVFALAVLSSAFTGQAIQTGFDRRYGVLRLLGASPLGKGGLVLARVLAVMVIQVIQFVVLGGVGLAMGWRPAVLGVLPFVVFWLLGTATFVGFALLFAGTLRAEATLALANLVWVLMLGVGGVLIPGSHLPGVWATVVSWLPSAALGDGFRAAFEGHGLPWQPLVVLVVWGTIFCAAAARLFRWSD
ncbi:ABC transporter permease [Arsenicicoccus sp. oral taxon 190]|uniref:ABC transporter permease n=1 Tax=Arsenicicoccus sp. oral taxon 190 TaxID=1658671 RepID=UPI000679F7B9|nr:ABC transporter permease [Arsenicicoccus sp. oral taxon 190]AKT51982.1 ABC transporter [Arsenicicoccus sp. oral taxon 190]